MKRIARRKAGERIERWKFFSAGGLSLFLLFGQTARMLANPTGGSVVAGSAGIGAAGPTLTIRQSTPSAIINWQQFSIAGGELTKFIVPDSSSATLNRVVGGNPSAIYGTLQSNGTLYLVNPSGIVVGPSGRIDTAEFLASTLDVSNQQFLAGGDLSFAGSSGAAIDNEGTIHASSGDVYLIANQVNNNGTISAPQGNAGLAAGSSVLLQQAGTQHLFVEATPAATTRATGVTNAGAIRAAAAELRAAGGNAYALAINNTGDISATGYARANGHVYLTSDGGNITSSGHISARTANGNGGTIVIDGTGSSTANTVLNSGTLDASATVAGGQGGTVTLKNMGGTTIHSGKIIAQGGPGGAGGNAEVSGKTVQFTGTVDLTAPGGTTGNLLLDPATLDVITGGTGTVVSGENDSTSTSIDPTTVEAALGTANLTLNANTNITVTNGITWTSTNTLTLSTNTAGSTINLNAPISGVNGGLTINTAAATDQITTGASGSVAVANFILQSGAWNQNTATLPAFNATTNFELEGSSTFERFTGGSSSTGAPYQITDVYGLEGLASPSGNLSNANAELVNNIDASGTSTWIHGTGTGFFSIGNGLSGPFTGSLNGQGNTINDLYINDVQVDIGLIGDTGSGATIENLGLTNEVVNGAHYVGGLVGFNPSGSTVKSCYATGAITGYDEVGGLVGGNAGLVETSYASGTVTGVNTASQYYGGLVGRNSGTVQNSYATGTVTVLSGSSLVGGLVGGNDSGSVISSSYSTGSPSASGSTEVGGLVGNNLGTIANSFWDTTTSGQTIGVGSGTTTGATGDPTATLLLLSTYTGAGWSIDDTDLNDTWVIFSGQTRPLLSMEASTTGAITNAHQLQLIGVDSTTLAANYNVANNIDATGTTNASDIWGTSTTNGGGGFFPIGESADYTGTFNGQSFTINGLYVDLPAKVYGGLFGQGGNGSLVENVNLTNAQVLADGQVGALMGYTSGTVNNCSTSGAVSAITGAAADDAGGIVGNLNGGVIENSHNLASVLSESNSGGSAGGITGNSIGILIDDYNQGAISATHGASIGGILGYGQGSITGCYNTGSITGAAGSTDGGVAGYFTGTDITDSFNTGAVTCGSAGGEVGGVIGYGGNIVDTYSTGAVSGGATADVGGVIGYGNSVASAESFYDSDTAGVSVGTGNGNGTGLFAATTAQLESQAYVLSKAPNWDFTTPVWTTVGNTNTPQLVGLPETAAPTLPGDTLSGTAYMDSGVTLASGVSIDLIFDGSLLGSPVTTTASGAFSFTVTPAELTGGVLLTDATDQGNTYYQANSPASTITGVDLWGSKLRVLADTASNTALGTAAGSLTTASNGINYTVNAAALATNTGVSMNLLSNFAQDGVTASYTLDGNITASGALTTSANSGLTASASSVTLAASSMALAGSITSTGTVSLSAQTTGSFTSPGSISDTGAVHVGSFILQAGDWVQNSATLPAFSVTSDFELQGSSTFERIVGLDAANGGAFEITDIYGLQGLASPSGSLLTADAELVNNIDATTTTTWNSGAGFVPIGKYDYSNSSDANTFSGTFNGQGYAINGLTINLPSSVSGTGLFGDTATASTVENLNLTNASVTGETYVGALAGVDNATVTNVTSSGTVTGTTYVGGLVGISAAAISNSSTTGTVSGTASGNDLGGLDGFVQFGSITGCFSAATISGSGSNLGGLVGLNDGTVETSYATGTVSSSSSGSTQIGGLVAENDGTVETSYATGTVSGSYLVGGLVGFNDTDAIVEASYATGAASGNASAGGSEVGGLVGGNEGTVETSYATGAVSGAASVSSDLGGLVGNNTGAGAVQASYATGAVSGTGYVGGLVGINEGVGSTVETCYSIGAVTAGSGSEGVGGLVGYNGINSTVQSSYWATDTSGQSTSSGGSGETLAAMKLQSTFLPAGTGVPNWDFVNTWTTLGNTVTPELIGVTPGATATTDTLSGTAYTDSGVTIAPGVSIDLIFDGSLLGAPVTTNTSGAFSFTVTSTELTGGVLLTDATDKGNTYYQANSPALNITGVDLWGSTLRVLADTASNTALGTAAGSLTSNGINYTVNAAALATNTGINMNILSNFAQDGVTANYTLGGNITASGALMTSANSTFSGSANVTLTGSSVALAGTFNRTGSLAVTSGASVSVDGPTTSSGGQFLVEAPVITLNAAISATSGNIVLVDSSQFVNNAGVNALSATGGDWQVWSVNPPALGQSPLDNDGGLTPAFIQYGATYGTTTAAASGDGLLYSYAPAPLAVSLNGTFTKIYDSTLNLTIPANSYTLTTTGVVPGDVLSLPTGALNGILNSKDVATANTVTVSPAQIALSASRAGIPVYGYTAGTVSAAATVTPATLTASLVGLVSKVYDGTTTAVLAASNYSLAGVFGGDQVTVTGPASGTYASKDVGSGIDVTSGTGLVLSGAEADDYLLSTTAASGAIGTITPATLTASLTGMVSKVYDSTTAATLTGADYLLSGVLGGDIVMLNDPVSGTYNTKDVGTGKAVTVTGLALSGAEAGDYLLGSTTASAAIGAITPATLTATVVGPVTKVYDGTTTAVLAASNYGLGGVFGGDQVTVTGPASGTYASKDVGSAIEVTSGTGLVLSGAEAGDYVLSTTTASGAIGTITPATLTARLTGVVSKVYDSTTVATLTGADYLLSGVLGGDIVMLNDPVSGTYDTKDVGTGKTVTVTGLALSGAEAGDYLLGSTTASAAIGAITPATLTAALGTVTKVYDGTTSAVLNAANIILTGVFASDSANVAANATGTYDTPEVGTGKLVTPGSVTLSGTSAGDYQLNGGLAPANVGTITPAPLYYVADPVKITIGSALPTTYLGNVIGFVGGDTLTSATTGTLTFTSLANATSPIGSYAIDGGGLTADSNYTLLQAAANATALTIAPLFIAPSTITGGADHAGSNIVPPQLTPQYSHISPKNLQMTVLITSGPQPTPFSFAGGSGGVNIQASSSASPLAESSSNGGNIGSGDVAQLNDGELNNANNHQANGLLNLALGPGVHQNLVDALQDWSALATASASGAGLDNNEDSDQEMILKGGDVGEIASNRVQQIPLDQAPPQLQKALGGDVLRGMPAGTGR